MFIDMEPENVSSFAENPHTSDSESKIFSHTPVNQENQTSQTTEQTNITFMFQQLMLQMQENKAQIKYKMTCL